MLKTVGSRDSASQKYDDALVRALQNARKRLQRCMYAAGVRAQDVESLVLDAIDSVPAEAWSSSSPDRVLLQVVDEACSAYAGYRSIPYRPLLSALERQWPTISTMISQVAPEPGTILVTLVRTTPWGNATVLDQLLISEVDRTCAAIAQATGAHYSRLSAALALLSAEPAPSLKSNGKLKKRR